MLKIGLTGGIASGKSTVAALFAAYGVKIIDADEIAHSLVRPGQDVLHEVRRVFGDAYIREDGSINRERMSDLIFSDSYSKKMLESIIHPLVRKQIQTEVDAISESYCLISVPLLFEASMQDLVDRVLVVNCLVDSQINRLSSRDGHSPKKIEAILRNQLDSLGRSALADDLIDNNGDFCRLSEPVKKLHLLYQTLSKRH